MTCGGFTEPQSPSSRGVFDEAISRLAVKTSNPLLAARWASPLLRGATPLSLLVEAPDPSGR
ncbi:MAG: hypothetical protein JNJ94_15820 [Chlorobi bacterium]|nr:hypothetical protein [Chlorobiota bacterium]